jgi:iron complex transport system substrate-binding protein
VFVSTDPHMRVLFASLIAVVTATATTSAQSQPKQNVTRGCVERFDAGVDYFPDKVGIEDARNVRVEYRRSYKVVTVPESYPGGPLERYVLVQCGAPRPPLTGELSNAQVVTVPITSLYSASTTHLPLLVDLERLDVLTGVSNREWLVGDEILAHARKANVKQFAAKSVVDVELVVGGRPSLFMTGGTTPPSLSVVRGAGIPVVANVEWIEGTALGRAEWLKYMAVFLNEERRATRLFAEMKDRYRDLSARANAQPNKPLVMTGRSDHGRFTISGGRSYVARLIADAGGRYTWADNTATSAPQVDLEAQMQRSAAADIWINGGGWKSLATMVEDEPRYAGFKAVRNGQIWVYERRQQPNGANDYWTRSVSHPDLVLADLVKIFHPTLMREHTFEWYMQLPAR